MAAHWLSEALAKAGITQAPELPSNVAPMQRDAEKLRKEILAIQNELVQAQCEQARIEHAKEQVLAEIAEALSANQAKQDEIQSRLDAKRSIWVALSQEAGVRAELVARVK